MNSMEKIPPEEAKKLLSTLMRIAECPVCLRTPRPPALVQCSSGHVVCSPCRPRLEGCPVCRSEFIDTKPSLMLCQLLESLPQICKHPGCGRRLEDGKHLEGWCVWSPTKCKFLMKGGVCCDATVSCRDLVSHVKEHHGKDAIDDFSTYLIKYECKNTSFSQYKENILMNVEDLLFWVMYSFWEKSVNVSFLVIPNTDEPPDDSLTASITVKDTKKENNRLTKFTYLDLTELLTGKPSLTLMIFKTQIQYFSNQCAHFNASVCKGKVL